MKTNLFFVFLLVCFCVDVKAQNDFIELVNHPDTIQISDTLIVEVKSAVWNNGNPCSPLTIVDDTLSGNNLSFDLTFDFTGFWSFACVRLDTLYYSNLPQQDSIIFTSYYT